MVWESPRKTIRALQNWQFSIYPNFKKMNETILGAVLALSGVLLTLIATPLLDWWRDRLGRRAAKKERELQMKREAYLPLVAAYTEGMGLLARILAVPPDKLTEIRLSRESENALAIKDLVVSGVVLETTAQATKAMNAAIMKMMAFKAKESMLSVDLSNVSKRIDQLNKNNEEILGRMEASSAPEPGFVIKLHSRFQLNQEELELLFARQKVLFSDQQKILQEIGVLQFVEIAGLGEAILPAVIAMRNDLGVFTDEEHIRSVFQTNQSEVVKGAKGVVDGFWDMLREHSKTD